MWYYDRYKDPRWFVDVVGSVTYGRKLRVMVPSLDTNRAG